MSGFPNGDVIYLLLDEKLEELREEINTFSEDIYVTVNQLFKTIINRFFARFPKALNSIEELIISFLDQEFNKTKKLFNDLAEMNFTYLYVDELSKEYKTLIQDSLLKKGLQVQTTSNDANNTNYLFNKDSKDISFFKSNKDKDSYYQGLANYVKSLVDFIYSEMIRNLREYIPKAAGNFFIKSLKTNMNFYLLQYISKNPEMCDDLEEDQDVAQKRAYYKEDNTKIIENILQQQGINSQNAQENTEDKEKKPQKSGISINDIGLPLKKEPSNNISQATKNNLFGSNSSKANNLFGKPIQSKAETTPNTKKNTTNLFGQPSNTNSNTNTNTNNNANNKKPANNNLFGNLSSSISKGASNLFGNSNKTTPKTNQPNQTNQTNQANQKTKDLNVSLKIDPKEGSIKGANIKGNIDPKDAMNFYNKNKQNLPTGQQVANAAQKASANPTVNNATKKASANALANLFGKK